MQPDDEAVVRRPRLRPSSRASTTCGCGRTSAARPQRARDLPGRAGRQRHHRGGVLEQDAELRLVQRRLGMVRVAQVVDRDDQRHARRSSASASARSSAGVLASNPKCTWNTSNASLVGRRPSPRRASPAATSPRARAPAGAGRRAAARPRRRRRIGQVTHVDMARRDRCDADRRGLDEGGHRGSRWRVMAGFLARGAGAVPRIGTRRARARGGLVISMLCIDRDRARPRSRAPARKALGRAGPGPSRPVPPATAASTATTSRARAARARRRRSPAGGAATSGPRARPASRTGHRRTLAAPSASVVATERRRRDRGPRVALRRGLAPAIPT